MSEVAEKPKKDGISYGDIFIVTDPAHPRHLCKVRVLGLPVEQKLPVREECGNSYLIEKWQITSEEDMDKKAKVRETGGANPVRRQGKGKQR